MPEDAGYRSRQGQKEKRITRTDGHVFCQSFCTMIKVSKTGDDNDGNNDEA